MKYGGLFLRRKLRRRLIARQEMDLRPENSKILMGKKRRDAPERDG
jgi:hypothetical protein